MSKFLNFDIANNGNCKGMTLNYVAYSKVKILFLYTILCYDVKILLNYKLLNCKNQVGTGW